MDLLDNIKLLCKEKKVSQRRLEQDLGLSNGASSKWSKSSPSTEVLQKIANYFNVSIDYLTGKSKYRNFNEELMAKKETDILYASAVVDFAEPEEAIKFILSQPTLMDFGGYDLKKMTDEEILEVANDMLFAMKLSLERRKK